MAQPELQNIADAPFDGRNTAADVILRSKDSIDFYVHKSILSLASPVFRDMFSLPQPPPLAGSDTPSHPIIGVTEDSKTLYNLLHLCYPVLDPTIIALPDIVSVLEVALKYQIEKATSIMRAKFSTFVISEPLRAYVIACRLDLEEEATKAAKCWRENRSSAGSAFSNPSSRSLNNWKEAAGARNYIPEMAEVSAGAYFRLLRFIRTGNAQSFTIPDPADTAKSTPTKTTPPLDLCPPNLKNADIVLQSSEGVNFRVHRWIVSMTSPHLLDTEWGVQGDLPVFKILEDAKTLGTLLWLCYPFCDPEKVDADVADAVLRAARKYHMAKVIKLMKRRYMKEINVNPLRVYFTAARFGWKEEAREAASIAAGWPIDELYVPEMESVSAGVYHHLLKYCHCYPSSFALAFKDIENPTHYHYSSAHEWIPQYLKNAPKIEEARSQVKLDDEVLKFGKQNTI